MSMKQRGSGWSIRLVFTFYKLFGYTFIYYLMYPVTFFYFLVAGNVKVALRDYYQHINKPFNNWVYFEHLRHFAITMCDRFVSKVSPQDYTFDIKNEEELMRHLHGGGILLLSHFGGWASAGNCFSDLKINIVMQEALIETIKCIEENLERKNPHLSIIDLSKGGVYVTMKIASALLSNEIVAMMADRATDAKHKEVVTFFGKEAEFNKNPFSIAYKTEKPLMGIAFSYQKPQHYRIEFIEIMMDKNNPADAEIHTAMQTYADFFATHVNLHPEQWFNLYPFWKETI